MKGRLLGAVPATAPRCGAPLQLWRSHPGAAGGREDPKSGRGDAAHAERLYEEHIPAVRAVLPEPEVGP